MIPTSVTAPTSTATCCAVARLLNHVAGDEKRPLAFFAVFTVFAANAPEISNGVLSEWEGLLRRRPGRWNLLGGMLAVYMRRFVSLLSHHGFGKLQQLNVATAQRCNVLLFFVHTL